MSCSHFPWIFKVNDVNCPPIQPDFGRHLQPWSRDLKTAFRKLARQWHPARDPRADRADWPWGTWTCPKKGGFWKRVLWCFSIFFLDDQLHFFGPQLSPSYIIFRLYVYIYINMSWVLLANPMLTRPKSEPKMNRATTKLRFLGVFIVRGTPD